jgi:prophage tail gpP-like protein
LSDKVSLFINRKIYDGWKSVEIKRSLKAASGSFSLSLTDRWSDQLQPWIVAPGDEAEVRLGSDVVITGYVDTVSPSMDKDSRAISVSGRDKTADLIDCSVEHSSGEIAGVTLKRLAEILAAPFGVSVTMEVDPGPRFDVFKIQQGETVFEALDRASRKRGFLLTTDTKGALVITRPGLTRSATRLEQGINILNGSGTFSEKNRFSKYIVKGQDAGFSAPVDPAFAYSMKATATDPTVKRYRPLIIQAEQLTNLNDAKQRANWEATNRAARASTFNVNVQGWRQGDGSLWRPNLIVETRADWIGLNGDLLITDVSYRLDDSGGEVTSLNLERKDAYKPEPTVPEKADPLTQAIKKDPGFRRAAR